MDTFETLNHLRRTKQPLFLLVLDNGQDYSDWDVHNIGICCTRRDAQSYVDSLKKIIGTIEEVEIEKDNDPDIMNYLKDEDIKEIGNSINPKLFEMIEAYINSWSYKDFTLKIEEHEVL